MKRYCTKLENRKDAESFLAALEAKSCVRWYSGRRPTRSRWVMNLYYRPCYLLVGDSMQWSAGTLDAEELDNLDFLRYCSKTFPLVDTVADDVSSV